jgi:hypothetical protein
MGANKGHHIGRSVVEILFATLIAFPFLSQLNPSAEAALIGQISLSATFNGEVIGDFNGTDYVGPFGHCSSGITCSNTFLPATATVTGAVTETTGMVDFGTGTPEPATIITQTFQGTGPFGAFATMPVVSETPGSLAPVCQQNLLTCLSINGFGGTTKFGSPLSANVSLQPNYSGAPLNSTTLPIQYPFNFTSDALIMGQSGGTFESGNTGQTSALSCSIFGGSLDSFGRCNVGSVSGTATSSPPTQPPTAQTIASAELAQYFPLGGTGQIVQQNPDGTFETFSPVPLPPGVPPAQNQFHATLYQTADQSQTIVAMTGGTLGQSAAADYTYAQAIGTFTSNPGPIITSQTDQLAALVKSIANSEPATQITLTSYSIGGIAVQVVAQAAGIQGVTLNSQGAENILPSFAGDPNLSGFGSIATPSSQIVNYRLKGDQVSLWSPEVGSQITVADPPGLPPLPPLNIFGQHDISNLAQSLGNESPEFPGNLGSLEQAGTEGDFTILPNIIFAIALGNVGGGLDNYQTIVTNQALLKFDPPPGWSYSLTETSDSPEFASMMLPLQDNIAAWELTYFTDTGGSGTEISDTGMFDFGPGVDRLDFFALDDQNDQTAVVTPFVFGLTFDGPGTFNGTLVVMNPPNSVPEPNTIVLLSGAVICLGWMRRRPFRRA